MTEASPISLDLDRPPPTKTRPHRRDRRSWLAKRRAEIKVCFDTESKCRWIGIVSSSLLVTWTLVATFWPLDTPSVRIAGGPELAWGEAVSLASSAPQWSGAVAKQRDLQVQMIRQRDRLGRRLAGYRTLQTVQNDLHRHAKTHQLEFRMVETSERRTMQTWVADTLGCTLHGHTRNVMNWMADLSRPEVCAEVLNAEFVESDARGFIRVTVTLRAFSLHQDFVMDGAS
ncbi:MAG: hypothetical protein AAF958_10140 [Planctomycetota bacterium]